MTRYQRGAGTQYALSRLVASERESIVREIERLLMAGDDRAWRMVLHMLRDDVLEESRYETRVLLRFTPIVGWWGDDRPDEVGGVV